MKKAMYLIATHDMIFDDFVLKTIFYIYMYLEVSSIKANQLCVSNEFIFYFHYFFFK